ncbi:uncharacterized protein LOC106458803 isoform X3 [Limulus polyphemus]|uniref:Uncharacterized protein LOC106458803 isoform X3 n=1 Tax=Limulus polyphemus TaxID=6850 RepID=A0ABM1SB52_LIMPO|nr:uncharacterized protein LOC106458803 isoform X3 [Limulus polyphemus]
MTSLKTDCKNFAPNMFSKTKCQHCFKIKDAHSAEALENSRATRNVSKCGYLFVAPDFDFSVPLNRTKRWQRRWFVLYDDGELTYSVDEHPDTIPQALIDMNNVLEVSDAESVTESPFSLAITTTEKAHFIKGTSREEANWWFDVLSRIARNTVRGKNRRFATIPGSKPIVTSPTSQNLQPIVFHNQVPANALVRPRFNSFTSKTSSSTTTYSQPAQAVTECTKNATQSQTPNQYQPSRPHIKNTVLPQTISSEQILSTQVPPTDHVTQISHLNCSSPSERWIVPTKLSQLSLTNLVQCHTLGSFQNTQSAKQNVSVQSSSSQPISQSPLPLKTCTLYHSQNISVNAPQEDGLMSAKNLNSLELKRDLPNISLHGEFETCKGLPNEDQKDRSDWDFKAKERSQAEIENKNKIVAENTNVKNSSQQYLKQDKRGGRNLRRTRSDGVAEIIKAGSRLQNNRAAVSPEKHKYGRNDRKEENNCHSNPLYVHISDVPKKTFVSLENVQQEILSSLHGQQQLSKETDPQQLPIDQSLLPRHFLSLHKTSSGTSISSTDMQTTVDSPQQESTSHQKTDNIHCTWQSQCVRRRSRSQNARSDYSQVRGDPDGCGLDSFSVFHHSSCTELMSEGTPLKKGWLMRQGTKDWHKHWVVLTVCSLTFYQDPRAEISNIVDGKIDVLSVKSVGETKTENSYGFTIETLDSKRYTFSAVTAGVCNNWIQALHHATKVCTFSSHSGRIGRTRSQERVPTMRQDLQLSLNMSSTSDDQSVLEDPILTERFPSSVRTLPSSPPLNRTVISKVKEKSRSRSSSRSRLFDKYGKLLTSGSDDHSSPVSVNDCHTKKVNKISTSRDSDFEYPYWRKLNSVKDYKNSVSNLKRTNDSTEIKATQVPVSLVGEAKHMNIHSSPQGLQNGYNLIEINPDSCGQLKHTINVDTGPMSFEERSQKKHLKDEWENGRVSQNICMLERNGKGVEEETGKKFPKGKLIVIEDLQTSLHLCRDRLFDLKQRLENTPEVKEEALLIGKDILMLCGEIEKILGLSDQKLGNENEISRLKDVITELQVVCEAKNVEVEKLTNKIITLKSSLNDQEQGFQKFRTEVDFLQKDKMSLKDRVKQLEMVLRTSDSDHYHNDCCKALSEENTQLKLLLDNANETIKSRQEKLQKDYESYDNLEMINSQLEQSINEFQSQHCSRIALMITKVNDLTLKLAAAEKSLGYVKEKLAQAEPRQENQRSSLQEYKGVTKEFETKLKDLESKINYIEACLNNKFEDDIHIKNIMTKDSNTAVESQGNHLQNVLVRLNSLNSRVKTACEIVGTNQEVGRIREVSTKPEIWLRRSSEAEASQEDWSTFSVVDSLPDLFSASTEDGMDSTPMSLSSCTEMLVQKVKMVAAWIKETLVILHKQHYLNEASSETSNYCVDEIGYLVKACQCLLPEDRQSDKNPEASLVYLLLALQEIAIAVIKLNELESLQKQIVMKEVCMINKLVTLVESKINTSSIGKADSYNDVDTPFLSSFTSLLPTCTMSICDTLSAPEDDYFQNKDIVDDDLRNKLCELQEHWIKVRKLMDTVKRNSIAILVRLLQNDELQRSNQESLQGDLISENIISEELLLGEIYQVILCQSKMSQKQVFSKFQEHCVTALYSESTSLEIWNIVTQNQMAEEMEKLFAQIKNSCVKNVSFHVNQEISESKHLSQQSMLCLIGLTDMCIFIGLLQGATIYCAKRVDNITLKEGAESDYKKCIQLENSAWPESLYSHLQQQAAKMLTGSCPLSPPRGKAHSSFTHLDDPLQIIEKLSKFSAHNFAKINERYIEKITEMKLRYQEEVNRTRSELEALKQKQSQWLHGGCPSCEVLRKGVNCLCFEVERCRELTSQGTLCQTCKKLSSELEEAKQAHKKELESLQGQLLTEKENLREQLTATFNDQVKAYQEEGDRLHKELQLAQKHLEILKLENEEQMRILMRTHQQKVHVFSEQAVRQRYQEDLAEWKSFSEKSLNDIEKSYKRLVEELRNSHKQEVERLKTEKEQALEEEIQATKTALAVIKETYQKELQEEISRCKRENMKQHPDDFETLYKEHRDMLDEIRKDMVSLTEKFSIKCLENATLKEHLEIVNRQKEESSKLLDFLSRGKQSQAHSSVEVADNREPLKEKKDSVSVNTSEPMGTLNILCQCYDLPLTAESGLQFHKSCSQNSTIPLHLYMKETSVESQTATDHQRNDFSRTED